MTETTTETTEPAESTTEEQPQSSNREAAGYRVKLRDTEAERDTLRTRVESMQRAEVERIAGTRIDKASAVWASGVQLGDLLDEDGNVDQQKVTDATLAAKDSLGLTAVQESPVIPRQGDTPDRSVRAATSWRDALGAQHNNVDD